MRSLANALLPVQKRFETIFKSPFKRVYDHKLTIATGAVQIDLDALEHLFRTRDQLQDGQSLAEAVQAHYGSEAVALIVELL